LRRLPWLGTTLQPTHDYPPADPCQQLSVGAWVYQGLLEARQRACQQQRDAAARQQQADYYVAQARQAEEQRAAAQQRAEAEAQARATAAAQKAAESSPNNICHDPATAGTLIKNYNEMSWSGWPIRRVVDIEHLVTISNANGILRCHGMWIHTTGAKLEGTMTLKPNVAGDIIVLWEQEHWQPPVLFALTPSAPIAVTTEAVTPFQQGLADRQKWEVWFASLSSEYRSGAYFWSGQRSLPQPQSCSLLGGDATAGCLAAQARLAPSDARRKLEPDYRLGWNSFVDS
jgi:hypothetical protein